MKPDPTRYLDVNDTRLTPRERNIVRMIAGNLQARSGRFDRQKALREIKQAAAQEVHDRYQVSEAPRMRRTSARYLG